MTVIILASTVSLIRRGNFVIRKNKNTKKNYKNELRSPRNVRGPTANGPRELSNEIAATAFPKRLRFSARVEDPFDTGTSRR